MGYQKANLVANGQMQASPFVTIGTNGVFLSDLSVTGDPIESEGGCWANVSIAMLTGTGFNQYVGDMIKTPLANNASPLGNANEIYFDQGEAMWLNVDAEYAGCKIDYKGGVFNASFAYPLVANGQMVGNPYPAPVYLADITVAGDPIESEGGCWANVSIAMLTGTGFNQYVGDMIKTSPTMQARSAMPMKFRLVSHKASGSMLMRNMLVARLILPASP